MAEQIDIKAERKALGISRQQLAGRANIDKSVLQLLELNLSHDDEARRKVVQTIETLKRELSGADDWL